MEPASRRQVKKAAQLLSTYVRRQQLHRLSYRARGFVTTNSRSHTVSRSKLSLLSKEEMDRLLRELKR